MIATLNKPNKTISLHKDTCKVVQSKIKEGILLGIENNPNGILIQNNQLWIHEKYLTMNVIRNFFGKKDYAKIFCSYCFSKTSEESN